MLGAILPIIGGVLDKIIPDKGEASRAKAEMAKMYVEGDLKALEADVALATAQIEVNKQEAAHADVFVAGWRPAIGWICGFGFAFNYILYPLLTWWNTTQDLPIPPALDTSAMLTLLMGMLGLGGFRTYEKLSGKARSKI